MGLFSMFKGDSGGEMTPHKAFAIALMYCMGADGEMDPEEVGHLLAVIGGERSGGTIGVGANNRALLESAMKYVRTKTPDQFLAEAVPVLTTAQKLCILMNIVDSALADGQAEQEEQQLFDKFQKAFGITDEQFKPYFDVIMLKCDRSVFVDKNHPNNRPDFQVELSGRAA
ncbi:MAG TPA: TerB family tellurite resistance protein [Azospirillaceae bacterium]|nr:TerB family tellurite resistance protein [Azospirillaceae bacterium]